MRDGLFLNGKGSVNLLAVGFKFGVPQSSVELGGYSGEMYMTSPRQDARRFRFYMQPL